MVSNAVVGSSITSLGWCVPLGSVIGCGNIPLSAAISPVPLLLANMGLWVDGLYLPFANYLLRIIGSLLLFSIRVPTADFGRGRFLCLFRLALRLFNFLGVAGLLLLSFARALITNLS